MNGNHSCCFFFPSHALPKRKRHSYQGQKVQVQVNSFLEDTHVHPKDEILGNKDKMDPTENVNLSLSAQIFVEDKNKGQSKSPHQEQNVESHNMNRFHISYIIELTETSSPKPLLLLTLLFEILDSRPSLSILSPFISSI